MGGAEAARRIIELDPDARLVVCSGYSNEPAMSESDRNGFRGAVSKPFRLVELLETISKSIA